MYRPRHTRRGAIRTAGVGRSVLTLAVLALVSLTLRSVAFSGASFTAGVPVGSNVFSTGNLLHSNSQSGLFVVDAAGMAPGDSSVGTMTITGGGTVAGVYTLSASGLVDVPGTPRLSDALTLTIADVTGSPQTLFQGPVSSFSSVSLGSVGPAAVRTYRVTVAYPAGANSAGLQGSSFSVGLVVTGVSP